MKNFVLLVSVLGCCWPLGVLSENNGPFMVINDKSLGVEQLLFGDLTDMKDVFLPSLNESISSDSEEVIESKTKRKLNFDYINGNKKSRDIQEFNDITKILNNVTRRSYYHGFDDPEDTRWWWSGNTDVKPSEANKKFKLVNINLQFLVHARYQIQKVLKVKNEVRMDKRYKLGYLFNRLRRLKYEQEKIASYAIKQVNNYRSLTSQLTLYEKMVRYDVDISDTMKLILEIDKEPAQNIYMSGITPPIM